MHQVLQPHASAAYLSGESSVMGDLNNHKQHQNSASARGGEWPPPSSSADEPGNPEGEAKRTIPAASALQYLQQAAAAKENHLRADRDNSHSYGRSFSSGSSPVDDRFFAAAAKKIPLLPPQGDHLHVDRDHDPAVVPGKNSHVDQEEVEASYSFYNGAAAAAGETESQHEFTEDEALCELYGETRWYVGKW